MKALKKSSDVPKNKAEETNAQQTLSVQFKGNKTFDKMNKVIGNSPRVSQLKAQQQIIQKSPRAGSFSTQAIQLFKDADEDENIISEVIGRIEMMGIKGLEKETVNTIKITRPYGGGKPIYIEIRVLRYTTEKNDPVLLSANGPGQYILFVHSAGDNQSLNSTIRAAILQLQQHSMDTPSELLKEKVIGETEQISSGTKNVRKLEDGLKQAFQTDANPKAVWQTILSWLPGLEEGKSYEANFERIVWKLAGGVHITISAATRLVTELCEHWFFFNRSKLSESNLIELLLAHIDTMLPGIIQRHNEDQLRRAHLARDTDTDHSEQGIKKEPPQKTVEPESPKTPVSTVKKDTGAQTPTGSVKSQEQEVILFPLDFGGFFSEEEETPKTPRELLIEDLNKKKQTLKGRLNKLNDRPELKEKFMSFLEKDGTNSEIRFLLDKFLSDKDAGKETDSENILIGALKTHTNRVMVTEMLDAFGEAPLKVKEDFLEPPTSEPDTPLTKKTIENAIEVKFISAPEAALLERHFGFTTTVELISYYRKNNSIAPMRALMSQLFAHHHILSNLDEVPPVTSKSLIIDTNIAKALISKSHTTEEAIAKRKTLDIIGKLGITDIRLPNMVVAELHAFGSDVFEQGNKATQSISVVWYPLPIEGQRDKSGRKGGYGEDLDKMAVENVGGAKGSPDRQIVADALHAQKETGSTPKFMTADKGIMKHLFDKFRKPEKDESSIDFPEINRTQGFEKMVGESMTDTTQIPHFVTNNLAGSLDAYPVDVAVNSSGISQYEPDLIPQTLEEDEITRTKTPIGPAGSLFDKPIGNSKTLKVKHLFALIQKNGHKAVIAGGAVRDFVRGEDPNDIDLTTDMHIDALQYALEHDEAFKSVPLTPFRLPELNLIKLAGKSKNGIDITCSGDKAPKKLDEKGLLDEVGKRDFSMNALFVNETGDILDPGGTGIEDAQASRLIMVANNFVNVIKGSQPYHEVGRLLKFAGRGFQVDPRQLTFVRQRVVQLLFQASAMGGEQVQGLTEILDKARERTPLELIEILKRLGFSDKTIRILFPDSARGYFGDQTPAYEHSVSPSRLENPQTKELPGTGPQIKIDTEHGKVYQYRQFVKSAKTGEPLMIDLDMTDHGTPGHWAYHYHVYRWVNDKWDKHTTGMSASGEAGRPEIDGGKYYGPEPWVWADVRENDKSLVGTLSGKLDSIIKITETDGIVNFGNEISMHVDKIKELIRHNQLASLLMMVRNIIERGKLPDREDMARIGLTTTGGERLRFEKQFYQVVYFLEKCQVSFESLNLAEKIRLYDLLQYNNLESTQLVAAAKWAKTKAGTDVFQFTHFFESFIVLDSDKSSDPEQIGSKYEKIETRKSVNRDTALQKVTPELQTEEIKSMATSGKLEFSNDTVEKYHFLKHRDDMSKTPDTYSIEDYLNDARLIVKSGKAEISTEQLGSTAFVFIHDGKKAVVRVEKNGKVCLATAFTLSKREREVQEDYNFLEKLNFGSLAKLDSIESLEAGTPTEKINRRLASLESFLIDIQGETSNPESGLRKLKMLQIHLQKANELFEKEKKGLDAEEFVPLTQKRIQNLKSQIQIIEKRFKDEESFAYLDELIRKLELENTMLKSELSNVESKIIAFDAIRISQGRPIAWLEEQYKKLGLNGDFINHKLHIYESQKIAKNETVAMMKEELQKIADFRTKIEKTITFLRNKPVLDLTELPQLIKSQKELSNQTSKNDTELGELKKEKTSIGKKTVSTGTKSKIGGVKNAGNTCYIASTLQIIANTTIYRNAFIDGRVHQHPRLAAAGRVIIESIRDGEGIELESILTFRSELMRAGWLGGNRLYEARQQDAAELLNFILDTLQADGRMMETHQWHDQGEDPWAHQQQNPIRLMRLGGLGTSGHGAVGLDQLVGGQLNQLTVEDRGVAPNRHHRRNLTGALPDTITVQLNRFKYSRILEQIFKLDQKVTGTNTLTIPANMAYDGAAHVYDLTGFVLHIGQSAQGGHYVSYIFRDDHWYCADDSNVRPVGEAEVTTAAQRAYLYTYLKRA